MPVDVFNGKYYKFDFDELTTKLKGDYKSDKLNKYLNDWNILLHRLDNISLQEYNLFVDTFSRRSYYPEYYQFTQIYAEGYNPYIFNFFIDHILSNIQKLSLKKKYIYVKRLSKIASLDNTIALDDRSLKTDPIVICPFILPDADFIVIDGNTRMNYYLKSNKLFTSYIIYNIISKEDFLLSVDWAMYNFVYELNTFLKKYKSKDKLESVLIKSKIYLQTFIDEANRDHTF